MKLHFIGDIDEIMQAALEIFDIAKDGTEVVVTKIEQGLFVKIGDRIEIGYNKISEFVRAATIMHYELTIGTNQFKLREKPQFESCGVMVDVSRDAVLKIDTIKDIMRRMAKAGLNQFMLYMEDVYEIEDYPYFGYMRGRYTKSELKKIVRYGNLLGIETIPCIQTLAHLQKALRWDAFDGISDQPSILLIDEPETYKLIEEMIKMLRECHTSAQIHIGMDEAHGVGLNKYYAKHGATDRFALFLRHLNRVAEIAEKYNFKPMMWSDMFFRLGSQTNDYYDLDAKLPDNIAEIVPKNISMVYWDYYTHSPEIYNGMLRMHSKINREIIFAGGIWTWDCFNVRYSQTFKSTYPALEACRKHRIKNVFATMWGGSECSIYEGLAGMQLYSEYNFYDEVSHRHLAHMFKVCAGGDLDAFILFDADNIEIDDYNPGNKKYDPKKQEDRISVASKQLFCQDVMLGLFDKNFESMDMRTHYKGLLDKLRALGNQGEYEYLFDLQRKFIKVLVEKCDIGIRLKCDYDAGKPLDDYLPELTRIADNIAEFHKTFSSVWYRNNKPHGFARLDVCLAGVECRVRQAIERIQAYIDKKIESLPELEEQRLPFSSTGETFHYVSSADRIMFL